MGIKIDLLFRSLLIICTPNQTKPAYACAVSVKSTAQAWVYLSFNFLCDY